MTLHNVTLHYKITHVFHDTAQCNTALFHILPNTDTIQLSYMVVVPTEQIFCARTSTIHMISY